MRGAERGCLLLTSRLGAPDRRPLSRAQFRELTVRAGKLQAEDPDRDMVPEDLTALGYAPWMAEKICALLGEEALLDAYLRRAKGEGITPITRASEAYPLILRKRLGLDAPGCLWAKGDLTILDTPAVSLVGSRELRQENRRFAEAAGRQAALQGLTLVSGNARGADRTAQEACLEAGGRVISVVADSLVRKKEQKGLLCISESSFDEPFSSFRALSRNHIIHALGRIVLVAQSDLRRGGTWDGTFWNLKHGISPAACFRDGSDASRELEQLGAYLICREDLKDLRVLSQRPQTIFDM